MTSLSLIVPVLNESERIAEQLQGLRSAGDHELIVVDGGSSDGTPELAEPLCDRLLVEGGGLAKQLNRGAREATGETLFFPYADTRLPETWPDIIARVLADERAVGGAFRLGFDSPRQCFRVIAQVANMRGALGCGPLGDQGIFCRRTAFDEVGGFRAEVLLEDLDFVRRLRRCGRVVVAPEQVRSSVRRWESHGVVPTLLRNWLYLTQHLLGLNGKRRRAAYQEYRVESH